MALVLHKICCMKNTNPAPRRNTEYSHSPEDEEDHGKRKQDPNDIYKRVTARLLRYVEYPLVARAAREDMLRGIGNGSMGSWAEELIYRRLETLGFGPIDRAYKTGGPYPAGTFKPRMVRPEDERVAELERERLENEKARADIDRKLAAAKRKSSESGERPSTKMRHAGKRPPKREE